MRPGADSNLSYIGGSEGNERTIDCCCLRVYGKMRHAREVIFIIAKNMIPIIRPASVEAQRMTCTFSHVDDRLLRR